MEEPVVKTEVLDDGCIRICLDADGHTVCGTVSSYHLLGPKWTQLKQRLEHDRKTKESGSSSI